MDAKKPVNASGPRRAEDGRLLPGQSLNPSGKPKDPLTRKEVQKHFYSRGYELIDAAVKQAMEGDSKMMALLIERLLPIPAEIQVEPETAQSTGRAWTVAELEAIHKSRGAVQ